VLTVLPGLRVPIATHGHLLALKVLAGRDKDRMDARMLLQYAGESEVQQARDALDLIASRGFHRGKNLQAELVQLLSPER
jgi:hypothetical protein